MHQRIKWLDIVRCFGMFLIYVGHFAEGAGRIFPFAFTHHVALFFFVSGCAENLSSQNGIWETVKSVLKDILLPWLVFSLLAIVVHEIETNEAIGAVEYFLDSIVKGNIRNTGCAGAMWFLTCIAVTRVMFAVIKKLRFRGLILLVCFGFFVYAHKFLSPHPLVKPSLPYNVDSAMYYIVFYGLGYVLFPWIRKAVETQTVKGRGLLFISFLLSAGYSALLLFGKDQLSPLATVRYLGVFYPIIQTMAIIWMYFVAAKWLENVSILGQIGRSTLYLCISEYFIKTIYPRFMDMLGIPPVLRTPLVIYMYCAWLLVLATWIMVPVEKKMIRFIQQKISTAVRLVTGKTAQALN